MGRLKTGIHFKELLLNEIEHGANDDGVNPPHFEALLDSLIAFGQITPLIGIARRRGSVELIDGNVRLRALKRLSAKTASIIVFSDLSPLEESFLRLSVWAPRNEALTISLAKEVAKFLQLGGDSNSLPWKAQEVKELEGIATVDWTKYSILPEGFNTHHKLTSLFDD